MALKRSKIKRPKREVKQYKNTRKIEDRVFDEATLKELSKYLGKKIIDTVDNPIAMGKEANVFRATQFTPEGEVYYAIKIYRIETSSFDRMEDYINGDPRFARVRLGSKFQIVSAWTSKEYANLMICKRAGIHSPNPVTYSRNILIMELLGEDGIPFPKLAETGPINGEQDLDQIIDDIKKLYDEKLVHADLSEYNILMTHDGPYFIDVGQAVILKHPKAEEFLRRDVINVLSYFNKQGIKKDVEEVLRYIKS